MDGILLKQIKVRLDSNNGANSSEASCQAKVDVGDCCITSQTALADFCDCVCGLFDWDRRVWAMQVHNVNIVHP